MKTEEMKDQSWEENFKALRELKNGIVRLSPMVDHTYLAKSFEEIQVRIPLKENVSIRSSESRGNNGGKVNCYENRILFRN